MSIHAFASGIGRTWFQLVLSPERALLGDSKESGSALQSVDLVGHSDDVWKDRLPERLEHYVREMYSVVRQREALVRAFASEARILPESIRSALREFMEQRKARFVDRLKQAQELGLVRKDVDLSAASDLIRDSIHSAILRHTAYGTDPEAVDAYLQRVADIFYYGIKANHGRDY